MATTRARAGRKKAVKKGARRKKAGSSRKRLTPAKQKIGLEGAEILLQPDGAATRELSERIRAAGGVIIGGYHEPLSGRPILLAALPIAAVEPTPFQRDLSPTHTKKLAQKIAESGSFLDPLIVVTGPDGELISPNGRHRLAAAKVLGLRQITALVSSDPELAFRILALNTEKAHNLKDRSLEVIRMARELVLLKQRTREADYAEQFESPALLTLGIVFEQEKRFAGGAYHPFLRKLDRFSSKTLAASLREREAWASRLLKIEVEVKRIIEELRERGFRSPYLRNLVVARINPVRFHRPKKGDTRPAMEMGAGLTRMTAAARKFKSASVNERDLALVAAVSVD